MARNKNKNKNQQQNQQKQNASMASQQQPKPVEPAKPITLNDLDLSKSNEEFEKNKKQLLEQAKTELKNIDEEKNKSLEELEKIKQDIKTENAELEKIREEKKPLEEEIESQRTQLAEIEKAKEDAEKAKEKAEEEARTIVEDAESESLNILTNARETAKNEKNEFVQRLDEQRKELDSREIELHRKEHDIEYDREALEEEREFIQKQRERYDAASPAKIEELEIGLSDAKDKYDSLREKYEYQTKEYNQVQSILDDVEANSGVAIKSLLSKNEALKTRNEELERIHEKYPDEESIEELEKAKEERDKLKAENENLDRERRLYKDETLANRSALRELESVKCMADAAATLNEHLKKELESYKTALESRTGDSCPALTKVDSEVEEREFCDLLKGRNQRDGLSDLKEIVNHVKNYAGSRKKEEQLYYKDNDIRAFLAGMAVSRLIILQGMSGTGKSSLPRIFSEAISGFDKLVPVESSWRDRNELLGYYNDFNKKFNAKTFTIELYRSGKEKCRNVPTFIILDEMNLARIEYYFSDFLAVLQDPDKEKWIIELVSNDMRTLPMDISVEAKKTMREESSDIYSIWERYKKSHSGELGASVTDEEKSQLAEYLNPLGLLTGAKDLIAGRKIRVPKNVWFIGTANRDESTFEITDKVYDRAQVISLDEKGESEKNYAVINQKKIDIGILSGLFEKEKNSFDKAEEVEKKLKELDDFLIADFDVSFGNRIARQSVEFAAVFTAAGGELTDALDYQISTKILRKVISSDDKDALSKFKSFAVENDYQKTESLISKRLKNLG